MLHFTTSQVELMNMWLFIITLKFMKTKLTLSTIIIRIPP